MLPSEENGNLNPNPICWRSNSKKSGLSSANHRDYINVVLFPQSRPQITPSTVIPGARSRYTGSEDIKLWQWADRQIEIELCSRLKES